jgi:alpha-ketoglutarate-dependent taurine dioxygenase
MALTITPLSDRIGAEVTGIDLKQPVDDQTARQLNQALVDHVAVVIRDQQLTPAEYLEAVRVFGEPMRQHYSQYNMEEFPNVGVISHRNGQRPASGWHTDHTNHERPPKATVLYAVSVPSQGGNTSVANMRAAYAALPGDMKQRLQGLKTVNTLDAHIQARPEDVQRSGTPVCHPLVRTHPENGTQALYFHPTKTQYIEGMTPEASQAFLQHLLDTAIRPEFVYQHQWRVGDLLIFDNRCAVHKAHDDYDRRESRLLYRIILQGDRPV